MTRAKAKIIKLPAPPASNATITILLSSPTESSDPVILIALAGRVVRIDFDRHFDRGTAIRVAGPWTGKHPLAARDLDPEHFRRAASTVIEYPCRIGDLDPAADGGDA